VADSPGEPIIQPPDNSRVSAAAPITGSLSTKAISRVASGERR
jgi:hypothetical protein